MTITEIKIVVEIIQALVIISLTTFTSWWAYKTFAHKEKIEELKKVLDILTEFSLEVRVVQKVLNHEEKFDHSRFISLMLSLNKELSEMIYLGEDCRNKSLKFFYDFRKVINEKLLMKKLSSEEFEKASLECIDEINKFQAFLYKISRKYV